MSNKDWVLVPRVPTDAMVEAICAAVAQGDWPNAYPEQAQQRRRRDARLAWLEAVAAAPNSDGQNVGVMLDAARRLSACPSGKCADPARDCFGSGCLGPNVEVTGKHGAG